MGWSSMLDQYYGSFGRAFWGNHTVLPKLTVACERSCSYLVRGSACYHPRLVRARWQHSESTHIAALILSEGSPAIALFSSEPTVSCQSPPIYSLWSCQRLLMHSPWSCHSQLSVVRVCVYCRHYLVRGFSWNRPRLLQAYCKLPECIHIITAIICRTNHELSESIHESYRLAF